MLSAGAGSVAAGVPMTVMPAPLVAAGGLAMYLESAALRDYLLFVAGSLGTGEDGLPPAPRTCLLLLHLCPAPTCDSSPYMLAELIAAQSQLLIN